MRDDKQDIAEAGPNQHVVHKMKLARTFVSGVAIFDVANYPELSEIDTVGHTTTLLIMKSKKVLFAGNPGQADGVHPPTGFHLTRTGISTVSPLTRVKVGVAGYVEWANSVDYNYDKDGFWMAIAVDSPCAVDFFQVDWVAFWF